MPRIVSRRPLIGVGAGIVIGALGLLLLGMNSEAGGEGGVSRLLFSGTGYFFLFVAAVSFIAAARSFLRRI